MKSTIQALPLNDLVVTAVCIVYRECITEPAIVEDEIIDPVLHAKGQFEPFGYRCDCCGSRNLIYTCSVVHTPTLRGYHIGRTCASKIQCLQVAGSKIERLSLGLAERRAARKRVASWLEQNAQHCEIVRWAEAGEPPIARDVAAKLARYGAVSEAQVQLLYRLKAQAAERAAEKAAEPQPTAPAPEGRVEVLVEVLGTKVVENDFGATTKALVRILDSGAKAWLTACGLAKGERARVRATFRRSDRDQFFAFGSRPKVLSVEPAVSENKSVNSSPTM
jgi:hypothetical protein